LLGSSADYPNHGIVKYYPLDPDANPNTTFDLYERIQILTTQGHPEYTEEIVTEMARQREEKHTITQKTADDYFGEKGRGSEYQSKRQIGLRDAEKSWTKIQMKRLY